MVHTPSTAYNGSVIFIGYIHGSQAMLDVAMYIHSSKLELLQSCQVCISDGAGLLLYRFMIVGVGCCKLVVLSGPQITECFH